VQERPAIAEPSFWLNVSISFFTLSCVPSTVPRGRPTAAEGTVKVTGRVCPSHTPFPREIPRRTPTKLCRTETSAVATPGWTGHTTQKASASRAIPGHRRWVCAQSWHDGGMVVSHPHGLVCVFCSCRRFLSAPASRFPCSFVRYGMRRGCSLRVTQS